MHYISCFHQHERTQKLKKIVDTKVWKEILPVQRVDPTGWHGLAREDKKPNHSRGCKKNNRIKSK